jgi:hypothetical protein
VTTTKHNHDGPYGFVACPDGCPRGAELAAGAPPRRPAWTERLGQSDRDAAARRADLAKHFASDRHNNPTNPQWCGRVCTYGEW